MATTAKCLESIGIIHAAEPGTRKEFLSADSKPVKLRPYAQQAVIIVDASANSRTAATAIKPVASVHVNPVSFRTNRQSSYHVLQ
jgi:hypothetical protein